MLTIIEKNLNICLKKKRKSTMLNIKDKLIMEKHLLNLAARNQRRNTRKIDK